MTLKLRFFLFFLIGAPFVLFFVQSLRLAVADWQWLQMSQTGRQSISSFVSCSNLIHELQKERGLSNLWSFHGCELADLNQQQKNTDKRLLQFAVNCSKHYAVALNPASLVPDLRSVVRQDREAYKKATKGYNQVIDDILKHQSRILHINATDEMTRHFATIIILEEARESLAQIRAIISGILARRTLADYAEKELLVNLRAVLIGSLKSRVLHFHNDSGIDELFVSAEWKKTEQGYLDVIEQSSHTEFEFPVKDFINAATGAVDKISAMITSEIGVAQNEIDRLYEEKLTGLMLSLLLSGLLVAALAIFSFLVIKSIITMVNRQMEAERNLECFQSQMCHAQRLESVGQIASSMAHDLRNILQVIIGYCEMLIEDVCQDSSQYEDLEQILAAAQKGRKLTSEMLDLGSIKEKEVLKIPLNQTLEEMQDFLKQAVGQKIQLKLNLCKDELSPCMQLGQLEQVVLNLAINARDAMTDAGEITVTTSKQFCDETIIPRHANASPGEYAVLTFGDTGHGIDQETRKRIFEPFFTTKSLREGTGLGLFAVQKIINDHGGFVDVVSQVGVGTTFKIYLPFGGPLCDNCFSA